MHRDILQALAKTKLDDAELLFLNERFSNAYYLFGYAAELAIKSRISRLFRDDTLPDPKFVNAIYTHNLNQLVGIAGLVGDLKARREGSPLFDSHWSTVSDWNESSRYAMIDVFRATAMRNAMLDEGEGVFLWLQHRW